MSNLATAVINEEGQPLKAFWQWQQRANSFKLLTHITFWKE